MKRSILVLVLTLALVGNVSAVTYSQWSGPDNGDWFTPTNWSNGVPNATDFGGVQGSPNYKAGFKSVGISPNIGTGVSVTTDIVTLGVAAGSILRITGGNMDISEYLTMGASATEVGTLRVEDGTLSTGVQYNNAKLFVGQKGVGTIEMIGGTINVGLNYPEPAGTFGLLTLADQYGISGNVEAQGTIFLNGGLINAGGLYMGGADVGRSTIIVTDGFLLLYGSDMTAEIQGLIDMGAIRGGIDYEAYTAYDPDGNLTIVGAVMIPEPATMCLLGFGVLGLIGRKK